MARFREMSGHAFSASSSAHRRVRKRTRNATAAKNLDNRLSEITTRLVSTFFEILRLELLFRSDH